MIGQEEIHNQCLSDNWEERIEALDKLKDNFSSLPDKQQICNDLISLTNDKDGLVRFHAATALGSVFIHIQDKQKAWDSLIKLANDKDGLVRSRAATALGSVFSRVPDKQQAGNDLHILTADSRGDVRCRAAFALGSAFSHVTEKYKQQAWDDLINLTTDNSIWVSTTAASTLVSAFPYVPDRYKQQAWDDLINLTNYKDHDVRLIAASALASGCSYFPDKQKAWDYLIKLANNKDYLVRFRVATALGSVFSRVPDKQQAGNDLHILTADSRDDVKLMAASTIGSAYSQIPDKQQAWNDLVKLTKDQYSIVRSYANHALGKISIFQASQVDKEQDYKKELEKAIEYFERAAIEYQSPFNPAQFCLPFYRSFYTIIFKKQEAKEEVDEYLVEAKYAIEGSKSKELLFKAVENLAEALKEVQNLENLDLEAKKGELKFYRQYCDRTAELLIETEEVAPFATIAMRKGLPILDRNLKDILEEIQKKAKVACKESRGTATEEIACTINREIQTWEIGNQEEMTFNVQNLVFTLEANTPHNPQNNFLLDRIKQIPDQKDVSKQYNMLSSIITLIINSCLEQKLHEIGEKVDKFSDKLEEITISLKHGISEELIIHFGPITQWGGIEYTLTIPLQDISYPELKEDLQKIMGKKINKLSKMPSGLASKVRDYLIQKNMWSILDKLT